MDVREAALSAAASPGARTGPVAVLLVSAVMWGFWWAPVRLLEDAGLGGAWVSVGMAAGGLAAALALLPFARNPISPRGLAGAALVGVAVTTYTLAVTWTDFVRAVLLFYAAPAWSTLIECAFMGRRWSLRALLAIGLSISGLIAVSGGEVAMDGLGAAGDWLALLGGVAWASGAALLSTARAAGIERLIVAGMASALVVALLAAALAGGEAATAPPAWSGALVLAALGAGAYLVASMGGALWGAARLTPTVATYLLSVEVLAGVAGAALILREPFGWNVIAGGALILGAIVVEMTRPADPVPA